MKLLETQELAIQKAQERNKLIDQYAVITSQLELKKTEFAEILEQLERLHNDITIYLNTL